jgi:hypothetical protein
LTLGAPWVKRRAAGLTGRGTEAKARVMEATHDLEADTAQQGCDYRDPMLAGLCRRLKPRHIALVGARDPALAQCMLHAAMQAGATLHVIARAPGEGLLALRGIGRDACVLHDATIPDALKLIPVPAFCWVDADRNWHTTRTALRALDAQAQRLGRAFPVTIVEGTGWPHGRRDGYDDPAAIPAEACQPHERAGLLPGQRAPAGSAGLYAEGYHASSCDEPGNGVLTAVEDFLDGRMAALRFEKLPGFGGRVVIAPRTGDGSAMLDPAWLAEALRSTAMALEAARIDQAVALMARETALQHAQANISLQRQRLNQAEPAGLPAPSGRYEFIPAPLRDRLRPVAQAARRIRHGRASNQDDAAKREMQDAARLRDTPILDATWYWERYPDVAAAEIDPALHYLRSGAAESRDPGPYFSTARYLSTYPDVVEAGVNPVLHYLACGAAEGRSPLEGFDPVAYVAAFPGLAQSGANPLEHFIAGKASF